MIPDPSLEVSQYLFHHPGVDFIWTTGGPKAVAAANQAGKPCLSVGPGNAPALVDATADELVETRNIDQPPSYGDDGQNRDRAQPLRHRSRWDDNRKRRADENSRKHRGDLGESHRENLD